MPIPARRALLALAAHVSFFSATAIKAQTILPHVFSDHAVLQRERPIHVWGWETPNAAVTVKFHGQTAAGTADNFGRWDVWLKPENAGGPFDMTVSGSSTLAVHDLLVGDVWLASGQSNMEMPLKGFGPGSEVTRGAETAAAARPGTIRLLRLDHKPVTLPQADVHAVWTTTTPETAAEFSAVAYFFGKELNEQEHVPIGLIETAYGGTPIEAWISLEGLAQDAALMPVFASRAGFANKQQGIDFVIAEEKRQDAEAIRQHKPAPSHPWHPTAESWNPASLYNGMIAPEAGYSMKGVIWYQGESNSEPDRAPLYAKLMPALIADWRTHWQQGDFPFLFVQLASYKPAENWGIVRDAQRRSLAVANTGMAVAMDVGNETNIHPPDKPTVGHRLALAARALVYGEPVEYTGPVFRQATGEGDALRVWFEHAQGLHAGAGGLNGFEIAGVDGVFAPAAARIDGDTVVLTSPSVKQPRHVRYGWANFTTANLQNKADLPAPAFASE